MLSFFYQLFFFFNDTATTEIYTLSLHDALPIWSQVRTKAAMEFQRIQMSQQTTAPIAYLNNQYVVNEKVCGLDRKSTRLNSSHANISYAVFCLKKKNT